jgi:hypothetical protein
MAPRFLRPAPWVGQLKKPTAYRPMRSWRVKRRKTKVFLLLFLQKKKNLLF